MPDITMCLATHCQLDSRCKRHPKSGTKPFEIMQAWDDFAKLMNKGKCDHFSEVNRSNG